MPPRTPEGSSLTMFARSQRPARALTGDIHQVHARSNAPIFNVTSRMERRPLMSGRGTLTCRSKDGGVDGVQPPHVCCARNYDSLCGGEAIHLDRNVGVGPLHFSPQLPPLRCAPRIDSAMKIMREPWNALLKRERTGLRQTPTNTSTTRSRMW